MNDILTQSSHNEIRSLLTDFDRGHIGTTALKQILSNHIILLDSVKLRVIVYRWALGKFNVVVQNIQIYPKTRSVLMTVGKNNSVLCLSTGVTTISPNTHLNLLNQMLEELLPESLLVRS